MSNIAKWCCKINRFLTNNSLDLCAITSCIVLRKINLFLARLPGIAANSNENYRRYNFQPFANISGNIKFLENSQSYSWMTERILIKSCEKSCEHEKSLDLNKNLHEYILRSSNKLMRFLRCKSLRVSQKRCRVELCQLMVRCWLM